MAQVVHAAYVAIVFKYKLPFSRPYFRTIMHLTRRVIGRYMGVVRVKFLDAE